MSDSQVNIAASLGTAWHVKATAFSTQVGYISGSGSPVGSVTPAFVGQEYFDTSGLNFWKANGTGNTNWVETGGSSDALGTTTITSTSANALAVGVTGATHPVFNVDASTASVATGMDVVGAAAGAGIAVKALSSTTNESMTFDAKGSGTITLNGTATGAVVIGHGLTINDAGNIALGTTTGTQIGTATSQKLGFFGTTPVVQQAGATGVASPATVTTASTSTTPFGYATSTQADTIASELATTVTAVNALITQLAALGLIA